MYVHPDYAQGCNSKLSLYGIGKLGGVKKIFTDKVCTAMYTLCMLTAQCPIKGTVSHPLNCFASLAFYIYH